MDDPKQQPVQTPTPSQQPTQPVSGKKEAVAPTQEWVNASTPEIVLPQEVKEAGVESTATVPPLPQAAAQAGVKHVKESTPLPGAQKEELDMQTPKSVLHHLKTIHKNVKESISWLIRLIIKEQDKKEKGGDL